MSGMLSFGAETYLIRGTNSTLRSANNIETPTMIPLFNSKSNVVYDDLEWLVGYWKCVYPALNPNMTYDPYVRGFLAYFVVLYPYADTNLTLRLTEDPDDRKITAAFVSREIHETNEVFCPFYLPIMQLGIGLNKIRIGSKEAIFDKFEFNYKYYPERALPIYMPPRLLLEDRAIIYILEKVPVPSANLNRNSIGIMAPLFDYSEGQMLELKQQYELLKENTIKNPNRGKKVKDQ